MAYKYTTYISHTYLAKFLWTFTYIKGIVLHSLAYNLLCIFTYIPNVFMCCGWLHSVGKSDTPIFYNQLSQHNFLPLIYTVNINRQVIGMWYTYHTFQCETPCTFWIDLTQVRSYVFSIKYSVSHSPNVSTTQLRQWGVRQCLTFSWTTLRGKYCWHPIAVMWVVDTLKYSIGNPVWVYM